jgi:peptide/nickel transport system ATP-binding protein
MSALLEVAGLCAEIRPPAASAPKTLLRGVSFQIGEGEVVGLVGQSGSGKSLTSLAIAGLLPRTIRAEGSILLDGREIIGANERTLNTVRGKDAAIIFQEPASALDPLMRIGRQIALPLGKHAASGGQRLRGANLRGAVFSLMEEVRLTDIPRIAASLPPEISGGQRQRAAIALALSCAPKLLIADEPTSAVDASMQEQLTDLICQTAARRNIAVLFITHDIALVKKRAARIMVMREGCIVEENTAGAIIDHPQHDYTRRLIAAARELENAGGEK